MSSREKLKQIFYVLNCILIISVALSANAAEEVFSPTGFYSHAQLSNNGKILALSRSTEGHSANELCIWDIERRKEIQSIIGNDEEFYWFKLSPNMKLIASSVKQKTFYLRDMETGEVVHSISDIGYIGSYSFSPNSELIATAGDQVNVWSVPTGKKISSYNIETSRVAFSNDGDFLAFNKEKENSLSVLSVKSGQETFSIKIPGDHDMRGIGYSLSFSNDNKYLMFRNIRNLIFIADLSKGTIQSIPINMDSSKSNAVFLPGSGLLAASDCLQNNKDANVIKILDIETNAVVEQISIKSVTENISYSGDGRLLAAGMADNTVKVWRLNKENANSNQVKSSEVADFENRLSDFRKNGFPIKNFCNDYYGFMKEEPFNSIKLIRVDENFKFLCRKYSGYKGAKGEIKELLSVERVDTDKTNKTWDITAKDEGGCTSVTRMSPGSDSWSVNFNTDIDCPKSKEQLAIEEEQTRRASQARSSCRSQCEALRWSCSSQCNGLSDKSPNWAASSPQSKCMGDCQYAEEKCKNSCL